MIRKNYLYPFDAVCQKPVERFDEQEKAKHDCERDVEFVSKDGECQERLGDEKPHAVIKSLAGGET